MSTKRVQSSEMHLVDAFPCGTYLAYRSFSREGYGVQKEDESNERSLLFAASDARVL